MLVVVCHRVSSLAVICGTGLFWLDVPSAVVVSVYAVLVAVVGLAVPGVALGRDLWIPAPLDVSDGQLPALDALRLGALGEPLIDDLGCSAVDACPSRAAAVRARAEAARRAVPHPLVSGRLTSLVEQCPCGCA